MSDLYLESNQPEQASLPTRSPARRDSTVPLNDDPHHALYNDVHKTTSRRRWWYIGGALAVVIGIAAVAGAVVAVGGGSSSSSSSNNVQAGPPTPAPTPAPTSQLHSFIAGILPDGGLSLSNPSSYQSKALQWLDSSYDSAEHTVERLQQRFALACIYYATYQVRTIYTDFELGENVQVLPWLDSDDWLESENECDWAGLECNDQGYVEVIDLHNNILTGSFPRETVLLKDSLKVLDIEHNFVFNSGPEQVDWLGELIHLEELNIAQTSFQYDGIPTAIGNLVNLVELDCSYTLFFGKLKPEVFQNLNKLQYLYIGGNSYNSTIPNTVAQMDNLLYMYAEFSDIEGDLSFIKGMPKIFELWVDKNPALTGQIPTEIGDLASLESLSFTECGLTGPLPTELGKLQRMQQMWWYDNKLEGGIPTELGNLPKLNRLEIEKNNLVGDMPEEICNRVAPSGFLEILEADCDGEISCPAECCSCCGEACAAAAAKPLKSGGNRRRRLDFVKELDRRRV